MPRIRFERVSFAYDGGDPVLEDITLALGPGWTGVVGANGAGKTTLVRLAAGELSPTAGVIARSPKEAACVVCAQRVDVPGLLAPDARWAAALEVAPDALDRWATLSPGERKRWQLA